MVVYLVNENELLLRRMARRDLAYVANISEVKIIRGEFFLRGGELYNFSQVTEIFIYED